MNKAISEKDLVIGIDIGTTNIKGCLYTASGDFLSNYSISYDSYTPKDGYHEQDPEDWVNGVFEVVGNLLKYPGARRTLKAISFSNQGGTVVAVDEKSRPVGRAITWMDRRGSEIFEDDEFLVNKNIDFYKKTGWRLDSHISFMPLFWIKKNREADFKKIKRILFVNDYVIHRISGKYIQDPSNASLTLLYNVREGKWDKEILNYLGISTDYLSEVKESGEVIGKLHDSVLMRFDISSDVMLINGGHDQYCTSIGAGIFDQEQTLLSTGTAWVIFKMLDKPLFDIKSFFAIGRNIIRGKFGLLYSLPASGGSIRWFAMNLMNLENEKALFKVIDVNQKRLEEIRNNILYYPYLAGTFDPDFDKNARATFTGIDISNSYLDILKAIMEGVAFHTKKVFLALEGKGARTGSIKMVGGGTRNKVWTHVVADVLNVKVYLPKNPGEDFAVKGAAIIASNGLKKDKSLYGSYKFFRSDFDMVMPDKDIVSFYTRKYQSFEEQYKKLYK